MQRTLFRFGFDLFDLFGRATEQWIGTNDQGLPSGESSGTNNMVKTEASTFDFGNDGGNGLLTSRTLYVEDSTTGQRVTNCPPSRNSHPS